MARITISHEKYGETVEFESLAVANAEVRRCFPDYPQIALYVNGTDVIDDEGDIVGYQGARNLESLDDEMEPAGGW